MPGPILTHALVKEAALVAAHRRALRERGVVYLYALGRALDPPAWISVLRGQAELIGLLEGDTICPPVLVAMVAFDPSAIGPGDPPA